MGKARRIGILTSGGDCPGLNAVIRGVAKASYNLMDDVEIVGIRGGFAGLIDGEYQEMQPGDFSGILTLGGTLFGASRRPFKMMRVVEDDQVDKVANMKANYQKMKLDCLLVLGGNGSHKTAALLAEEGLNVIGLPKTIDNDIYDTDITFGFHTAVDTATEGIDRLHTTAASHGRVIVVELMGNKAGWLTLYSGLAGGADIVLIPEIPFAMDKVTEAILRRCHAGKAFSILAVAEGAIDTEEAKMKKKDRLQKRMDAGEITATNRICRAIVAKTGIESRVQVMGHLQRGGSPSAYDRVLSTQFGAYAAGLIQKAHYGVTVAMKDTKITHNNLQAIAGKTKFVPSDHQMVQVARTMGICFGD